jgi:phosphoserine phosphatase
MVPPIVFDVDGTLTTEWYRDSNVIDVAPNVNMVQLARCLFKSGVPIVISTARAEWMRADTVTWLELNGVQYDDLIMRANDDSRMDFEVKRDQLNLIRSMYGAPLLWYDDNHDVTAMLREEGIPVIQVSPAGLPYLR